MNNLPNLQRRLFLFKKMSILCSAFICLFAFSSFTPIPNNSDAIVGVWKTGEGTAMVRIYKNGEKYQGKKRSETFGTSSSPMLIATCDG